MTRNTITTTEPTAVVIRLAKMNGQLTRVEIPYADATTQTIAQTVIDIITAAGMSLDVGDMITVQATPG